MGTDKERRKFIQATLVAPIVVGGAGRLHGAPASVEPKAGAAASAEKLVLPLAGAGVPSSELTNLSRVSALVESVLTDELAASAFFASPAQHFEESGLDGSDSTLVDGTISMLVALSDPAVKDALRRRNYTQVFDYMTVAGVFEARDPSVLQERVQRLIESNISEIGKVVGAQQGARLTPEQRSSFMAILTSSGAIATEDDLAAVVQILNGDGGATIAACSAMAACVVGIAVLTALYISVAVAASVAILAAITVSVALMTAVKVGGGHMQPHLASAPFTGQFMKLDPIAMRNMQRKYRLAQVTQDGELQLYALREAIREEVTAVLGSLSELGLIEIHESRMALAVDAVTLYALKTSGVPSNAY